MSAADPHHDAPSMLRGVRTVLCDLDGVVWLAHQAIPGSAAAIDTIRRSGRRVLFVTNNSRATIGEQEAHLAAIDIPATGDVVTSAVAAAAHVGPGRRVLVAGGPGVTEAVGEAGSEPIPNTGDDPPPVDAVIVGLHRDFDYHRLAAAARAVRDGAEFIATNTDATYPTPHGPDPGGGALVAAIATAAGRDPLVTGKPHRPMAEVIGSIVSPDDPVDPASLLMVGDRMETDGLFAATLGCDYVQVRTGVLGNDEPWPITLPSTTTHDVADLATLASLLFDGT